MGDRLERSRRVWRTLARGGFSLGAGILIGLIAAFGVMAPVFQKHPVVIAAPSDGMTPDLTGWQRLLDDRLQPLKLFDTDRTAHVASSLFDYRGLREEKAWPARLDSIRRQLLAVPPSQLKPADRLAWAINTYNFLVIDRITREQAARAAGATPLAGVKDVKDFFSAPAVQVEGASYSLDTFEHHFVFADVDRREGKPLPPGFDPRAHFAIVCGARGCPPLWPDAYRGATLDRQLEAVTLGALHSPAHLEWDPVRRTLQASQLFSWYDHDFGGPDGAMAFIMKHAPSDVTQELDRYRVTAVSGIIPWDWALNQRP